MSNSEVLYEEQWLPIADFPNYAVSNHGRIINVVRNQLLATPLNRITGYLQVSLWSNGIGKTKTVHRLVAETFISRSSFNTEVNHLDGDKTNNSVYNLEWITRSENQLHSYRTGLHNSVRNNLHPVRCVETGEEFDSIAECARMTGVNSSSISNCLAGRRRKCYGLSFEYIEGS